MLIMGVIFNQNLIISYINFNIIKLNYWNKNYKIKEIDRYFINFNSITFQLEYTTKINAYFINYIFEIIIRYNIILYKISTKAKVINAWLFNKILMILITITK